MINLFWKIEYLCRIGSCFCFLTYAWTYIKWIFCIWYSILYSRYVRWYSPYTHRLFVNLLLNATENKCLHIRQFFSNVICQRKKDNANMKYSNILVFVDVIFLLKKNLFFVFSKHRNTKNVHFRRYTRPPNSWNLYFMIFRTNIHIKKIIDFLVLIFHLLNSNLFSLMKYKCLLRSNQW